MISFSCWNWWNSCTTYLTTLKTRVGWKKAGVYFGSSLINRLKSIHTPTSSFNKWWWKFYDNLTWLRRIKLGIMIDYNCCVFGALQEFVWQHSLDFPLFQVLVKAKDIKTDWEGADHERSLCSKIKSFRLDYPHGQAKYFCKMFLWSKLSYVATITNLRYLHFVLPERPSQWLRSDNLWMMHKWWVFARKSV